MTGGDSEWWVGSCHRSQLDPWLFARLFVLLFACLLVCVLFWRCPVTSRSVTSQSAVETRSQRRSTEKVAEMGLKEKSQMKVTEVVPGEGHNGGHRGGVTEEAEAEVVTEELTATDGCLQKFQRRSQRGSQRKSHITVTRPRGGHTAGHRGGHRGGNSSQTR